MNGSSILMNFFILLVHELMHTSLPMPSKSWGTLHLGSLGRRSYAVGYAVGRFMKLVERI